MLRTIRLLLSIALFEGFRQQAQAEGTIKGYHGEGRRGDRRLRHKVTPSHSSVRLLPSSRANAFVRKHEDSTSRSKKRSKEKSSKRGKSEEQTNQPSVAPVKAATPSPRTASPVTLPPDVTTVKPCSEGKTRKGESESPQLLDCEKQEDRTTQSTTFPTSPLTDIPTILPTSKPTPAPTLTQTLLTAAPTTTAPITDSPSRSPVVMIQTTTVVAIDIDPAPNPSFQDVVEVAALTCDQIKSQGYALAAQAAPFIVARDISCLILRDSTADNIMLEISVTFEDSSLFIPGDSEIAALVCNAITGQNAATLLGQVPSTNSFSVATSVLCTLSVDATEVPTMKPSSQPVTKIPTAPPTSSPTSPAPTKRPTLLPSNAPTKGPTRSPATTQPTKAPTAEPTSGTLAPTFGIPTVLPTRSPSVVVNTATPIGNPTNSPTRPMSTDAPTQRPTVVTPTSTVAPTTTSTSSPIPLPTAQPTTSFPTMSPLVSTELPTLQPSVSKQPSPLPSLVTMSPSNTPSLMESAAPSNTPTMRPTKTPTKTPSLSPVTPTPTDGPTTSQPTSTPSKSPSPTIMPTRSPSLSPVTSTPTNSPTSSQPTVSPSLSPIFGTIVRATPFTGEYSINSLIALEDQDFFEAAETTCDHIRRSILSTFSSGFIAVETVCTLQQTNSNPLSIDFDLFVVFGTATTTFTTSDIDVLVETAFLSPALQSLLVDLQALDGFNPFSTTTAVTYAT